MRKDNENHRKPSHRINVCYPLSCHNLCKNTEKSWNSWQIEGKILLLHA
jgi:hypothetical protein